MTIVQDKDNLAEMKDGKHKDERRMRKEERRNVKTSDRKEKGAVSVMRQQTVVARRSDIFLLKYLFIILSLN